MGATYLPAIPVVLWSVMDGCKWVTGGEGGILWSSYILQCFQRFKRLCDWVFVTGICYMKAPVFWLPQTTTTLSHSRTKA